MENSKRGRPKTNKPLRNKMINIRMTEAEFTELQSICYNNRLTYIDVIKKGLEFWSK